MNNAAVNVENVSKYFRLYHDRNQYLKSTLIQGHRSKYEEFWAIKDVSFDVPHGATFGIIGSNGSGKSTLLKCLARILTPDKGHVFVNGRLSALLELGAGFHPDLSGRENIFLNGAILGMSRSEIARKFDEIVFFSGLDKFIDTPVKNYSSGMVVRLGFAIAINVDPEILVIDEVLAVGDESFQSRCYEKIESFRKEGRTIIIVSHGLAEIAKLCSQVVWLEKGSVKEIGDAYDIISKYTGQSNRAEPKLPDELGERWGSHEVEIVQAVFLDFSGSETKTLETGSSISLQIRYVAHTPIALPVFGVRITHLHGTNVWGNNTRRMGYSIQSIDGEGVVSLKFHNFSLLSGVYDLTIAITDEYETHEYDHLEKKLRFEVLQSKTFAEGLIDMDVSWGVG